MTSSSGFTDFDVPSISQNWQMVDISKLNIYSMNKWMKQIGEICFTQLDYQKLAFKGGRERNRAHAISQTIFLFSWSKIPSICKRQTKFNMSDWKPSAWCLSTPSSHHTISSSPFTLSWPVWPLFFSEPHFSFTLISKLLLFSWPYVYFLHSHDSWHFDQSDTSITMLI